jgi:molybdate transport system substrate-binding protein
MSPPARVFAVLSILSATVSAGRGDPAPPAPPVEITVYAAASLKDALTEIAPGCERQTGARLVFNFEASNDLARQIVAANKADVFVSADEGWMDRVAEAGLVDGASRRTLLSNRLVVVVPEDSPLVLRSADDLAGKDVKRLSLANPAAVPAGRYARAWLEKAGAWDSVRDRVVPAPDVRAALAAVESGAVEAGVVYRTDAAIARRTRIAFVVPEQDAPRIAYPVAALGERPHVDVARRFIDCLAGRSAREIFERLGFVVPGGAEAGTKAPAGPGR